MRAIAATLLLYLVLAAAFLGYETAVAPGGPDAPVAADLHAFYFPQLRYGFDELRAGRLPLWDPHQAAGTPLLAHPALGFFYPLYAPFLILDAETAIAVHMALHVALAALFTFLACRAAGMSAAAALIAGIVYAFQGSTRIKLYHPTFLIGAAAIPLLFWLVSRLLDRPTRRRAAALGLGVGVVLLGSELQFLYFAALAIAPLALVRLGRARGAAGGALAMLVLAGVLGTAIGSVRIVPGIAHIRESWRPPGGLTLAEASIMSLPPATYLRGLMTPRLPSDTPWWERHGLQESYVGIVPLLLALVGLALWQRRETSLPIAAVGLAALWYAGGADSALYRALFALPAGGWFRGPDRVLVVTGFAVAFLCGAGVDVLRRARVVQSVPTPWRAAAVAALAALVFGDLLLARPLGARLPGQLADVRADNAALFAEVARRQGYARTYVGGELDRGRLRFTRTAKAGSEYGLWLATDHDGQCGARLCTYLDQLGSRPFNPMGYTTFALTPENRPLADLLGIRFYAVEDVAASRFAALASEWSERKSDGPVALYETDRAEPRAFVVPRVEVIPDAARLLARLPTIDPRAVALVEEPLTVASRAPGDARIVEYEADRVVVEVSGGGGLLVLTDQYDRWWNATIDGVDAAIHRADYLFRGVAVPAGEHRVEMRYRPWDLFASAVVSMVAMLVAIALVVRR